MPSDSMQLVQTCLYGNACETHHIELMCYNADVVVAIVR